MASCVVEGCEKNAIAGGFCGMHRMRKMRHGHLETTRPKGWGEGHGHPLYERWRAMRRGARLNGGVVKRWDVFLNFVEDVGVPPTDRHKLVRLDHRLLYGPKNFEWRARASDGRIVGSGQEARNAYMRSYNADNPHILKDKYLKRNYGISYQQYQEMFDAQGGLCAICQRPETRVYKKTGDVMMLAVDHCHKTGTNRQLLCSFCNHGLGNFGDDVTLLCAAIAYLERHAAPIIDTPPEPA